MTERPELFWGLIASMWVGNLMLLVLNLPLVGLWIRLLAVPYRLLFPAIFVFCCIGVYTVDNKIFDIYEIAVLSARRLCAAQARLRAGADGARIHSRPDDGREPAPHDDDLVRRSVGVLHAADLGRLPDCRRSCCSWRSRCPALRAQRDEAMQE